LVERFLVTLPQHSVNDEFATLVEWHKNEGEFVKQNENICSAETTKALFDVEAENDGYLVRLVNTGEEIEVGAPLAVLTSDPDDSQSGIKKWIQETQVPKTSVEQAGMEATKKAQILADRLGLDIAEIHTGTEKLTAKDVLKYHDNLEASSAGEKAQMGELVEDDYPDEKLVRLLIIGGGEGADQVLDALAGTGRQEAVAILDDNPELKGNTIAGIPILGAIELGFALDLFKEGTFDAAIISISTNIPFRDKVFKEWSEKGIPFVSVIHPTAYVGMNARIGPGNVILAFCHIGAYARIGDNNFISAYSSIEHHSILGNGSSFGPGVIFSSGVHVGDNVRFGTGIFVEPFVKIGSNSIIASGNTLTGSVQADTVVKSRSNVAARRLK
jgi:sugar O-acyltransferase (sialic acid O-acetyltransferase NeuD family)